MSLFTVECVAYVLSVTFAMTFCGFRGTSRFRCDETRTLLANTKGLILCRHFSAFFLLSIIHLVCCCWWFDTNISLLLLLKTWNTVYLSSLRWTVRTFWKICLCLILMRLDLSLSLLSLRLRWRSSRPLFLTFISFAFTSSQQSSANSCAEAGTGHLGSY